MKVRVYYDGYKDNSQAQYRELGIWRTYKYCVCGVYGAEHINREFKTKEDAITFLNIQITIRKANQESEAAAKERSKKSGVVYEDVI